MNENEQEVESQELTDERMEELANGTERASNRDIPMTEADRPEVKDAKPAPQAESYEFKHGDKTIKATREQLIQWAQMGYGYPQKAQALNQQKAAIEKAQKEMEARFAPYSQVDEWAKKNPQDWQTFERLWKSGAWKNAQAQPGQPAPGVATPDVERLISERLSQQLQPFQEFVQQAQAERQAQAEKEADEQLKQEVQSIREKYKDLDWTTLDENGKSLEQRVLDHGIQHEIGSFSTAFRDLLHEQLISQAQAQAKMAVSRGIQEKTRLGILGQSPMPKKGFSQAKDPKTQSYEELAREAMEELKSGRAS